MTDDNTDNIIYVGNKGIDLYVKSAIASVQKNDSGVIIIRSRGKFISKAVDVAEILRRAPIESISFNLKEILIGTDVLTLENKNTFVSTMDIELEVKR